ncbi:MAG: Hsp20/alpha crystallin family protein [Gemmatimonadaceae bacterium]|nr:Hsp20/alpha crystallin family protein [Gemmatimonadaceae bacterium]
MTKLPMPRATPVFVNAFREMDEMQNRLRRFWNQGPASDLFATETVGWVPPVEIVEKPDMLLVTAELPGIAREHIDVTFEDDVLTIRGEKTEERKEEKGEAKEEAKFHLFERFYGTFARSFVVPRTIDPTRITAEFKDGVLTVKLPKSAAAMAKGRKIEVNATG